MEGFWKRLGTGCRKIICRRTSKGYNLAHIHSRAMSNSIALDMSDQASWEEQGKPLMTPAEAPNLPTNHRLPYTTSYNTTKNGLSKVVKTPNQVRKYSELPRFLISYTYLLVFGLANSFVVIIAHDWVPNRNQYLPLPDLTLDNVPYFPWAFHACEALAGVLFIFFTVLLLVHKHRFVILRRFFIIYGSVLLMRCPTLLLTSLSIPNPYMQCDPIMNDTMWSKFKRAGDLYMKFGMSSQGVKTCGDYMFSGHTVFLSLLNFSITEYTTFLPLHILSWILTLVAIFFIMLGKAHYSIDVVIAFFLSSLYFNYYHTLANYYNPQNSTAALQQTSCLRRLCFVKQGLRVWVPFYGYLEKGTGGSPLPLEFESPISAFLRFIRGVRHRVVVGKSRLV